jgi:hypothetical protein
MHVLYLLQSPASPMPVVPLIEYFIDIGRARALSWQRETARAVGLLVDFVIATAPKLRDENNPKVFAKFAEALVGGTLDLNGNDPSGLFWESKTVSAMEVAAELVLSGARRAGARGWPGWSRAIAEAEECGCHRMAAVMRNVQADGPGAALGMLKLLALARDAA